MDDQSLAFLNKFVALYQELLSHDGYGDMHVNIRLRHGRMREINLLCGREYRFLVESRPKGRFRSYKVVSVRGNRHPYAGPERRKLKDRRQGGDRRRKIQEPRHFRLERRRLVDRRSGGDRRRDN